MVNNRIHRVTRRAPVDMLAEEQARLHQVPIEPHTVVFGLARRVPPNTPMITFEHGQYSVPRQLRGEQVWVRAAGIGTAERIVIVHHGRSGPVEVARHARATPGSPSIDDDHFGGPPAKQPGQYTIRPRTDAEQAFLAIGDGAHVWLAAAAALGVQRIRAKMEPAVTILNFNGQGRRQQPGRLGARPRRRQRPLWLERPVLHPQRPAVGQHSPPGHRVPVTVPRHRRMGQDQQTPVVR